MQSSLSLLLGIALLCLLSGCNNSEQAPVRFLQDTLDHRVDVIEFTDGAALEIECLQVDPEGNITSLWTETLQPHADGLGNLILIDREQGLAFYGRGGAPFVQEMKSVDLARLGAHRRGLNGSIEGQAVVWSCFLSDAVEQIPNEAYPVVPGKIDAVVQSIKEQQCEGLILTAALAN